MLDSYYFFNETLHRKLVSKERTRTGDVFLNGDSEWKQAVPGLVVGTNSYYRPLRPVRSAEEILEGDVYQCMSGEFRPAVARVAPRSKYSGDEPWWWTERPLPQCPGREVTEFYSRFPSYSGKYMISDGRVFRKLIGSERTCAGDGFFDVAGKHVETKPGFEAWMSNYYRPLRPLKAGEKIEDGDVFFNRPAGLEPALGGPTLSREYRGTWWWTERPLPADGARAEQPATEAPAAIAESETFDCPKCGKPVSRWLLQHTPFFHDGSIEIWGSCRLTRLELVLACIIPDPYIAGRARELAAMPAEVVDQAYAALAANVHKPLTIYVDDPTGDDVAEGV